MGNRFDQLTSMVLIDRHFW